MKGDFSFGEKVICDGYLKKLPKGYYLPRVDLEDYTEKQMKILHNHSDKVTFVEPNDSISSLEYEIVERGFGGVLVGVQNIKLEIEISCESYENEFNDLLYYIYKHSYNDKIIQCAIVYYGMNRKRLVPLDMVKKLCVK